MAETELRQRLIILSEEFERDYTSGSLDPELSSQSGRVIRLLVEAFVDDPSIQWEGNATLEARLEISIKIFEEMGKLIPIARKQRPSRLPQNAKLTTFEVIHFLEKMFSPDGDWLSELEGTGVESIGEIRNMVKFI